MDNDERPAAGCVGIVLSLLIMAALAALVLGTWHAVAPVGAARHTAVPGTARPTLPPGEPPTAAPVAPTMEPYPAPYPAPLASVDAGGVITTTWIDGNTIEICTTMPGRLYVLAGGGGWWIGDLTAGCRAWPQPGMLVDTAFGPSAGRVYGLITSDGVVHRAAPLPRYWPVVLSLPVVAR